MLFRSEQLTTTARLVAREAGMADWALVYQSRSGRPEDPWLGPDVCDYLRGMDAPRPHSSSSVFVVVICPKRYQEKSISALD